MRVPVRSLPRRARTRAYGCAPSAPLQVRPDLSRAGLRAARHPSTACPPHRSRPKSARPAPVERRAAIRARRALPGSPTPMTPQRTAAPAELPPARAKVTADAQRRRRSRPAGGAVLGARDAALAPRAGRGKARRRSAASSRSSARSSCRVSSDRASDAGAARERCLAGGDASGSGALVDGGSRRARERGRSAGTRTRRPRSRPVSGASRGSPTIRP